MKKNIIRIISILLITISTFINVVAEDFTSDLFQECKEALSYETTKSLNPVSYTMAKKIKNIGPVIKKKYNDKTLLELNNQIISILSKKWRHQKNITYMLYY